MDDNEPINPPEPPPPYEPPRIVWREPFATVTFGASCAKEPLNPGCMQGPTSA